MCQEEAGEPWADRPRVVGDRWGESGGAQRQERTGGPLRPQRLDPQLPLLRDPSQVYSNQACPWLHAAHPIAKIAATVMPVRCGTLQRAGGMT